MYVTKMMMQPFLLKNFVGCLFTYVHPSNGLPQEYLCTLGKLYFPSRELRSGSHYLPEPVLLHYVPNGEGAFSIAASHLWNTLPLGISALETLPVFKTVEVSPVHQMLNFFEHFDM